MKQLIIAGMLSAGCLGLSCNSGSNEKAAVIPEVTVVEVGQRTVPIYSEYVGQTYGQSDIEIRPRAEGWIQSVNFKEGSPVQKGQLLYVIQDDELRDRVALASANLDQAKVLLVKAKADLDRVQPLVQMNALSQRELDAAVASYDAQQEAVKSAQAILDRSRTLYSYSRVTAPISGIIGISKVQVGDYVTNGATQPPINTISALGAMRVRFAITENDYLKFRQKVTPSKFRNLDVQLLLNDGSVFPEPAKLDFANREVDPSTGSLLVQAVVPNKSRVLKPGQYMKVRFESDNIPSTIIVPQQAVNQMQNLYLTYLIGDSNKIRPQPVKVGPRVGSNWVITEGLKPGERVALVGNIIVKPGMVVQPVPHPYSYDSTSGSN
jgi:membrane fusion protein (multidrug efflux system)